jgi:anti-sigma regulatory factor (Ser/Thr protein kinase)
VLDNGKESISLPAQFSSVPEARHFVADVLEGSQSVDLREAAALCVTELVANVVRHTQSRFCQLTVTSRDDGVRIEVQDDSFDAPAVQAASEREHGRGLRIVEALARDWGVERYEGDGKAVWVRLA